MSTMGQDLRFAGRLLRRRPGTAALAILALALALAANTTIFSVVDTVLLTSPSFPNASRLIVIWESNPTKGIAKTPVASATFRDWRQNTRSWFAGHHHGRRLSRTSEPAIRFARAVPALGHSPCHRTAFCGVG